jgi:hypothetical protein
MEKKLGFGTVFGKGIFQPYSLFRDMTESSNARIYGWIYCLGFSFLYSLTTLLLYLRGWSPVVQPAINLPVEKYYLYQTFFTIPVALLALGFGTWLAYWFSRITGSETHFYDYWGPVCIAAVIPSLITMWIPETFFIPFLQPQHPPAPPYDIIRVTIGAVWTILLAILAVRQTSRLNWFSSSVIGLITACSIASVMGYFFR